MISTTTRLRPKVYPTPEPERDDDRRHPYYTGPRRGSVEGGDLDHEHCRACMSSPCRCDSGDEGSDDGDE